MRPTAWVNLLAVFLALGAVANDVSRAQAMAARHVRPAKGEPQRLPQWYVKGDWMESDEEAVRSALDNAREEVTRYLRSQRPPMEWAPDLTWIQQKLLRDFGNPDEKTLTALGMGDNTHEANVAGHTVLVETRKLEGLPEMRRAAVRVEVSQLARSEIEDQERSWQKKERQERATARQGVMVRVLAGLVALLAVIACYLRLEDATKGYYTMLLRLVAVAVVTLVVAGILVLA
jgi:hypothetical protein